MEPEHAREELLEDHHPVIAPRQVRGLVAEDGEQLALAQGPGPTVRQQDMVAEHAGRDRDGDLRALPEPRRLPHRHSPLDQAEHGPELIARGGSRPRHDPPQAKQRRQEPGDPDDRPEQQRPEHGPGRRPSPGGIPPAHRIQTARARFGPKGRISPPHGSSVVSPHIVARRPGMVRARGAVMRPGRRPRAVRGGRGHLVGSCPAEQAELQSGGRQRRHGQHGRRYEEGRGETGDQDRMSQRGVLSRRERQHQAGPEDDADPDQDVDRDREVESGERRHGP